MSKQKLKVEKELPKKLKRSFGEEGDILHSSYMQAYSYLKEKIFPFIPTKIPELTSHDERHVINVLENISSLLGNEQIKAMNSKDLYFLCLSTIFHDAGLIYGRDNHQNNITKIYDTIRGIKNLSKFANEKSILLAIVAAHTGKSKIDNSYDTLKDLGNMNAYAENINVCEIAAILRFADELAEGHQRTSDFLTNNNLLSKESRIYHKYSESYTSAIFNDRIAITFNIFLKQKNNTIFFDDIIPFKIFLEFLFFRLVKLDEERKYCRYYCQMWLSGIKEISVDFKIWLDTTEIIHNYKPIILDDKIIPGDSKIIITDYYPEYKYTKINKMLKDYLLKRKK